MYGFVNAFKNLIAIKNIKINLLVFGCLAAGLLIPVLALANYNGYRLDNELMEVLGSKNTIIISGDFLPEEKQAIENATKAVEPIKSEYVYTNNTTVKIGQKEYLTTVVGVTKEFFEIEKTLLKSGKSLFDAGIKESIPVCVVEEDYLKQNQIKNPQLPFTIQMDGQEVQVVGIIKSMNYSKRIFMSQQDLMQMKLQNKTYLNTIYLQVSQWTENVHSVVQAKLKEASLYPRSVENANQKYETLLQNARNDTKVVFLIGFISIAFSIINFIMILFGKISDKKKTIGINLALGASKLDIFFGIFAENFIIGILATGVSLGIGYFFVSEFKAFSNSIFDGFVCWNTALICTITIFCISSLITKKITQNNIANLLST